MENNFLEKLTQIELDLLESKVDFIIEQIQDGVIPLEIAIEINYFINTKIKEFVLSPNLRLNKPIK